MKKILIVLVIFSVSLFAKLKIGVTLHPYYSFLSNVAGDRVEIIPLFDGDGNPHGYQINPKDIERALKLDAVILNGVGHDEFAIKILKASGKYGKIPTIYANKGVALIPQSVQDETVNSHTFVSITASIQQIYTIAKELGKIDPQNAREYRKNGFQYARKLRMLKADYMEKLSKIESNDFRCATIHGGYSYLLQEFGFQVEAVIEPAHGINPTASQLKETIDKIRETNVSVIFSEQDFPSSFISTIQKEANVRVVSLSHLSSGEFTPEYFYKGMEFNMQKLLEAVGGKSE